jgi:hypothetical protein
MVSKFYYVIAILLISDLAQANTPLQNEAENFSHGGIQSVAMTQPQQEVTQFKETDVNINEISEKSLKGSPSNLPRNLFRKHSMMTTQPFINVSMDDNGDGDDHIGNGEGQDDDAVAHDGEEEEVSFVEGVMFPEFFDTANLFTELSFLPAQAPQSLHYHN